MERIKCPICKRVSKIYLETIHPPHPDKKYHNIGVFCAWCGKIGTVDIHIEMLSVKLNTASFIKSEKERIRKEFNDAHRDWIENSMRRW